MIDISAFTECTVIQKSGPSFDAFHRLGRRRRLLGQRELHVIPLPIPHSQKVQTSWTNGHDLRLVTVYVVPLSLSNVASDSRYLVYSMETFVAYPTFKRWTAIYIE
jgi:hypothetical protein